jgi:hypothetical protein
MAVTGLYITILRYLWSTSATPILAAKHVKNVKFEAATVTQAKFIAAIKVQMLREPTFDQPAGLLARPSLRNFLIYKKTPRDSAGSEAIAVGALTLLLGALTCVLVRA